MDKLQFEDVIKEIESKKRPSTKQKALAFYLQKYLENNNASMFADLALYFKDIADLKWVENQILKMQSAYASLRFAKFVPIDRLQEHQQVVLNSNNASYCIGFAKIKGADQSKLSKVVLNSKSALNSYEYLAVNSKTDKRDHLAVIIEDNNPYHLLRTAIMLKGAGCKSIENAILKFDNAEYCYIYAKHVAGANIRYMQEMVLYTGSLEDILKFAQDIQSTDIEFYIKRLWEKFEKRPTKELKETLTKLFNIYDERNPKEKQ